MRSHVNLLPFGYRRSQLLRRRIKQWLAVWTVAAGIFTSLGWFQYESYRSSDERLTSLDQQCEPIKQLQTEIEWLRERIVKLRTREALSLKLADERSMLSLFGILSGAVRESGTKVTIKKLELKRQTAGDTGQTVHVLILNGYGTDSLAVASFAAALRDQNAFANVELRSADKVLIGDREVHSYNMECTF